MTDIRGILRDTEDERTLIPAMSGQRRAPQLIREGIISGGMIPKIECCIEAIRRGVKKVFIIDGRVPHAILIELSDRRGRGHHVLLMTPAKEAIAHDRYSDSGQTSMWPIPTRRFPVTFVRGAGLPSVRRSAAKTTSTWAAGIAVNALGYGGCRLGRRR